MSLNTAHQDGFVRHLLNGLNRHYIMHHLHSVRIQTRGAEQPFLAQPITLVESVTNGRRDFIGRAYIVVTM